MASSIVLVHLLHNAAQIHCSNWVAAVNGQLPSITLDGREVVEINKPFDWDDLLARGLDVVLAVLLLAFFLPLMGLIALVIQIRDQGPVLFTQNRIGRHGRTFQCLKFRSMTHDAEKRLAGLLASDCEAQREWLRYGKLRRDPRITSFGNFLRRSSLDELPQLFNVLRGC
jgi:exopolysaccharide production protein ExoY